jgi:hypothetical protein
LKLLGKEYPEVFLKEKALQMIESQPDVSIDEWLKKLTEKYNFLKSKDHSPTRTCQIQR